METTSSSSSFRIAESPTFRKSLNRLDSRESIYQRIVTQVYPMLRSDPFFGPHIKRLKGNLSDYYRYRIGGYRLLYAIDSENRVVVVTRIAQRKDAY